MLLRLDDASVRFGTLGERLGDVACSSEKKTCIHGWEHTGTDHQTANPMFTGGPYCTGAAKKKRERTVIKFATSALNIGLFKTLHALKKRMSLTGTSGTFKLSVERNVKVITNDGQFHLTAHQSCRQLLVPTFASDQQRCANVEIAVSVEVVWSLEYVLISDGEHKIF